MPPLRLAWHLTALCIRFSPAPTRGKCQATRAREALPNCVLNPLASRIDGGKNAPIWKWSLGCHRGRRFRVELLDFPLTGKTPMTEYRLPLNELIPASTGEVHEA